MNRVTLTGNLVKENETKYTYSKKLVLNNTLAVKKQFKNERGEYDVDFFDVIFWNGTADYVNKYTNKGDKLLVEGTLCNRTYERKDGTKAYITEIMCESVEILYKRQKENAENINQVSDNQNYENQSFETMNLNGMEITDSDLPF